ncbi:Tetratricopeptide repeat-containing protein [Psychroflexus salarius]|uniref:Tetratricopeptide repeat-containing protein n=1 Tax=Psychroflexus salarius TaxID=1155689 RepID=A0A1M4YFA0_9FLAO|nr:tetratricopeptide repeat protein [Psychroflexus salarius]SHF04409.1 Tetratricopeptide repeat-containing protein [Psychroflexus salarius]
MRTEIKVFLIILFVITNSCTNEDKTSNKKTESESYELNVDKERQEEIINEHLKNGAWKYQLYSQEYQSEIDKGLAKDSTIAYLWQQKSMPLLKKRKYEIGIEYLDKAVKYDRIKWQDYRAFIKCIFAKTYREAILDFEDYKDRFGYGFVMDHSFDFYIGLSYLQLNEFEKADEIFQKDYKYQLKENGKDWIHHLDLFYYGITKYELKEYQKAVEFFDLSLEIYPNFSEVQLYKAVTLRKLGKNDEAKKYDVLAEMNGRKGNTINEANSIYELYPYQWTWD